MARYWLAFVLLLPAWGADPTKTLLVGRGAAGNPVPAFDHGYMVFLRQASSAVEVWGPDGLEHFFGSVDNPYGANVSSIAVDADGSAAASLGFLGPETFNGGMAYFDPYVPSFVDPSGKLRTSIDLDGPQAAASDCTVILTDHSGVPWERIVAASAAVLDTRNATAHLVGERRKIVRL